MRFSFSFDSSLPSTESAEDCAPLGPQGSRTALDVDTEAEDSEACEASWSTRLWSTAQCARSRTAGGLCAEDTRII